MSSNGVIGRDGGLPWHLSADLKHFKAITMGKAIVMGRLTHESIGRPLPGRENIILTSNKNHQVDGCRIIDDLKSIISRSEDLDEVMIIGGAQLYRNTLDVANRLYITEVHTEIEGDVYFPEFDRAQWREIDRHLYKADETNEYDYSFVILERVAS